MHETLWVSPCTIPDVGVMSFATVPYQVVPTRFRALWKVVGRGKLNFVRAGTSKILFSGHDGHCPGASIKNSIFDTCSRRTSIFNLFGNKLKILSYCASKFQRYLKFT